MKRKMIRGAAFLFAIALFMTGLINTVAFAASTDQAKEKPDITRLCSLTLTCAVEETPIEGMEIELFRFASVGEDFQYTLAGAFEGYPVEVNGISSQEEWKEVCSTFGAYITADSLKPDVTVLTNEEGKAAFTDLETGLYLIRWTGNPIPGGIYGFEPFILSLPTLNEEGEWIYDLESLPKPGGNVDYPSRYPFRVIKQWKDYSDKDRPASVIVELYRDGQFWDTVELKAENNWTYTWSENEVHEWTLVERSIPKRYTVRIERDGTTFFVTNTTTESPPPPPQTGDTAHPELYLLMMAGAGAILLILGATGRKRRDENDE